MARVAGIPLSRVPGHSVYEVAGGRGCDDGRGQPFCLIGLASSSDATRVGRAPPHTLEESSDAGDPDASSDVITAWSRGAEQVFGYIACDIVGRASNAIVPHDRRHELRRAREAIIVGDSVPPFKTVWRRRDGRDVPLRVALHALRSGTGDTTAIAIVTDLARTATVEERLRHAQRLTVIGEMTADIAHDFNNLVTVMSGYNELVLAGLAHDDPRREYLLEVRGAADRATTLTRGLLTFGRRKTPSAAVDVNQLIRDAEGMLRLLSGKHVHVSLTLCPAIAPVSATPTQIEQVIVNLCVNARDAMPDGGTLTVETRHVILDDAMARIRCTSPGLYTMVAVSDVGVGMDPRLLRRIWEPFYTTKEVGHGTGLGLSTLLAIVKDAGGCINVESKVGIGTTFRVYLPAGGDAPAAHEVGAFEERAALPVRRTPHAVSASPKTLWSAR